MAEIKTDICVIGAGSGGLSVAAVRPDGASTVLIERGAWAAIASTTAASRPNRCWPPPSRRAVRHAGRFGVNGHEPRSISPRPRPRPWRDLRHRAQRLGRAVRGAGRQGHPRQRPFYRPDTVRPAAPPSRRAASCWRRDRAPAIPPFPAWTRSLPHQRDDLRTEISAGTPDRDRRRSHRLEMAQAHRRLGAVSRSCEARHRCPRTIPTSSPWSATA